MKITASFAFIYTGRSGGQMTVKDFKKAARHCMYPGYYFIFSVAYHLAALRYMYLKLES